MVSHHFYASALNRVSWFHSRTFKAVRSRLNPLNDKVKIKIKGHAMNSKDLESDLIL